MQLEDAWRGLHGLAWAACWPVLLPCRQQSGKALHPDQSRHAVAKVARSMHMPMSKGALAQLPRMCVGLRSVFSGRDARKCLV